MRSPRVTMRSRSLDDRPSAEGLRHVGQLRHELARALRLLPTASFTLPMRSRRAARSSRRRSRRVTRPSLRVRRASMPLRIQASSCAQNLSNLRCATASAASSPALRARRPRIVAREGAQQAAVELDDARRDAVEERAVVGDDDRGGLLAAAGSPSCTMPSMSRWLVGSSSSSRSGSQRERERERGALSLAARCGRGIELRVELEAMQERFELVLGTSARARAGSLQRRSGRQHRLLRHQRDAQACLRSQLAVVERHVARDDAEQRGLAGAVAADQADALARFHRERGAVEQRQVAVGELERRRG